MVFKYSNTRQDQYLYLMVSKKYGGAVQRNQLKRWIRVLYKETIRVCPGLGLMVRPIKSQLTFNEVRACFEQLHGRVA